MPASAPTTRPNPHPNPKVRTQTSAFAHRQTRHREAAAHANTDKRTVRNGDRSANTDKLSAGNRGATSATSAKLKIPSSQPSPPNAIVTLPKTQALTPVFLLGFRCMERCHRNLESCHRFRNPRIHVAESRSQKLTVPCRIFGLEFPVFFVRPHGFVIWLSVAETFFRCANLSVGVAGTVVGVAGTIVGVAGCFVGGAILFSLSWVGYRVRELSRRVRMFAVRVRGCFFGRRRCFFRWFGSGAGGRSICCDVTAALPVVLSHAFAIAAWVCAATAARRARATCGAACAEAGVDGGAGNVADQGRASRGPTTPGGIVKTMGLSLCRLALASRAAARVLARHRGEAAP